MPQLFGEYKSYPICAPVAGLELAFRVLSHCHAEVQTLSICPYSSTECACILASFSVPTCENYITKMKM